MPRGPVCHLPSQGSGNSDQLLNHSDPSGPPHSSSWREGADAERRSPGPERLPFTPDPQDPSPLLFPCHKRFKTIFELNCNALNRFKLFPFKDSFNKYILMLVMYQALCWVP